MKKQRVEKEGVSDADRGKHFVKGLLHWNRYDNNRQMPWKGEKDPYRIWLSEIILQQTRVEQGLKYFQNIITAFPNVHALAAAKDEKVFKLWEGLGYYSRCRNLIKTARYISTELKGIFPLAYNDVLALKGVGSYTAAAIVSFAYNQPYAVLDGNVFRVLSRIFDKEMPIDSAAGKKEFSVLAQSLLPANEAGEYNQAIMDFGAVICKPVPLCQECFFNKACMAYLIGKQQLLPVKEKKTLIRKRWLNFFIVQCGDQVLIQQRSSKDIWQGLHQFFLIETDRASKLKQLQLAFQNESGIIEGILAQEWKTKQLLSHQHIYFHFLHLRVSRKKKVEGFRWVNLSELQQLAFPKTLQEVAKSLGQ